MEISFSDISKIIELLSSKDAQNHLLGTLMLENFGILEDFQDDCIIYLTRIPQVQRNGSISHILLERILYATFKNRSRNSVSIYSFYDLITHNKDKSSSLLKLSFRHTGENSYAILTGENQSDAVNLAKFWLEIFRKQGASLELLPLDNIRPYLDIENLEYNHSGETCFNYELRQNSKVLNIVDFPLEKLDEKTLSQLEGKILRMRCGYFIRHQELLKKYPLVEIQIDEQDYYRKGLEYSNYHRKRGWMMWLDRGIFQGQYLIAVTKKSLSLFPNELALYPNLQIIYFPDAKLKILPYRLLRCKSLEYLVISTFRKKINVKPELAKHPSLKGIFFQHKVMEDGLTNVHSFFYMSMDEIFASKDTIVDLSKNAMKRSMTINQTKILKDVKNAVDKFNQYKTYDGLSLTNYLFDFPLTIFENITFKPNLISDEKMEKLLLQLKKGRGEVQGQKTASIPKQVKQRANIMQQKGKLSKKTIGFSIKKFFNL